MQVNSPSASRAQWYDRNPKPEVYNFQANGIAPHPTATRWTYAVPTGRKAIVEVYGGTLMRTAVATNVYDYEADITYVPSGVTGASVMKLMSYDNTGAVNLTSNLSASLTMFEGDTIRGGDYDASTGGTVTYYTYIKVTEYDA